MKKILFFLLLPQLMLSQTWVDMMQDSENNFYDTQREFNEYWKNKTIEKGKGWKQFKRWENFIEKRVFPDGIIRSNLLYDEYQEMQVNTNEFRHQLLNGWTQVGPTNVPLESNGRKRGIGRLNTVAFHPTDPNTIYVGAPAGGFWKSTNGGQTWNTTSTDFLTNLGVSDIVINPQNANIIYIITGDRDGGDTYSYGLMKSLDGGLSWQTTGLSSNIISGYRGNRILINPNNPDILLVATSNGLFRSTDAGNTFINTFSGANLTDIEFHPTNPNIVYGGAKYHGAVYKSSDNGLNWNQSTNGLPTTTSVVRTCVAVSADNPSTIYALYGNSSNGFYGLYKSNDEGLTWSLQSDSPNLLGWSTTGSDSGGQAWYDLALAVDPTNEDIVYVGGVNCWKSTNSGQSWNLNTHWYGGGGANYMHADEHMIKYNPLNNYIYSANDGGLYYSSDNGNNWTDISDGLEISQFYSLGVSQSVQDLVITGSQDNGTLLKDNINWSAVIGGDGMECIIDYSNPNIMYGALYYGDIRKSTNGGNSFSSIGPNNNGHWETPYILDRNNPQILYAGYEELYKSTNGGSTWNTITNGETNGGKIDEISVSKSDPNIIYFSDAANLYKTSNGGSSWNNVSNNLPYKHISYIIIHPTDKDRVWVTFSGYTNGEKVYFSDNGGQTWQNISGTLPNIPANCIVLDETSNLETLYIGTDLGVFTTDSTINDWSSFNNSTLPNVIVNELEIQYQSNKLVAATYGRGLWNIDLQITSPPIAGFLVSDTLFCNTPATVTFTNTSYYSNSYYWDFGDGSTSTSTNPTHTYLNYGIYSVSLIAVGPLGSDSVMQQQLININTSNPCIITLPPSGSGTTQSACNGWLYDVGGPNGNYFDNNNSWITIMPPGSNQITLNFTDFDIEAPSSSTNCNWDYLEIFDGPDTSANSLGQYCNTLTGTPGIVTSSTGSITIYLHADQAVNGRGFELNWTCTFPAAAPQTSFVASDTLSCDGTVSFTDMSTNGPSSWLWDFGDGTTSTIQNPIHTYSNGGIYTVSLVSTNSYGSDTLEFLNYINILSTNLTTSGDTACGPSNLTLTVNNQSNTNIKWFSDSLLINQVGQGNIFITPILNNSKTYYTQSSIDFLPINGGPIDNNFGAGSFYQGNRHLIFDNYKESILVSVLVFSNSAGNRIIELRNSSNVIIADTNIFIPAANNGVRIDLNFSLPVENNLQLGINGQNADLFRNNSGASFPYNISNIISITGTNAPLGYYYFFYDWEVNLTPCYSDINEVDAIINNGQSYSQSFSNCSGDSIVVGNNTYNTSGTYIDTFILANGCDSIVTTNVNIGQNTTHSQTISICDGDVLQIGSNIYTTPGTYIDSFSLGSCDSILTTNLIVLMPNNDTLNINICNGDSIQVGGNTYTTSGFYTDILTNVYGCDSIISTELTVSIINSYINQQAICQGNTYLIGNNIYTNPGIYTDTLITNNGCDSIVNTQLTINPIINQQINTSICEGEQIVIGNNIYTNQGIYTDSLTSIIGCDSIVTINLDIGNPSAQLNQVGSLIQALGFNGSPSYTYEIYGPNGLIFNMQNNGTTFQFSPSINGTYYFIVSDANNCISDTAYVTIDFINSIQNLSSDEDLIVYPNPTKGNINIEFIKDYSQEVIIELTNPIGEKVLIDRISGIQKNHKYYISFEGLSKGIYMLKIQTKSSGYIKKVIYH